MLIWWSVKSVFDSEIIQALGTVAIEEIHNFNCIKFFSDLVTVFQLLLKLQLLHTFKLQLQLLLTGFTLHAHYTYMQRLWTSSVYRTWKILHIQVNILFSFFFDMWSKKRKKVKFFLDFQKKNEKKTFSRTMDLIDSSNDVFRGIVCTSARLYHALRYWCVAEHFLGDIFRLWASYGT